MTSNWQEISFRIRHFSGKIDSSQMKGPILSDPAPV